MSTIPQTMKAWVITKNGSPSQALTLETSHPVPSKLEKGQVLVKIEAAALNPVGFKLMKWLPVFLGGKRVAEYDFAGVVIDSNGSSQFSNGEEIFGFISVDQTLKTRQGALAEYTRVSEDYIVSRPSNVSATNAAGLTLAGQTAYKALFRDAKLEAGQTIFINGGSTSVGAFAIQFAKERGARVIASASGRNEELVRSLGADEFLDYTKAPLHTQLAELMANEPTKPHVFIEAVGLTDPTLFLNSASYLAPGGVFLSLGPTPSPGQWGNLFSTIWQCVLRPRWLGGVPRNWKLTALSHDKSNLVAIRDLLANGKLKPVVDSVFSFEDALKAYDRIQSSRARGKVVVRIDPAAL